MHEVECIIDVPDRSAIWLMPFVQKYKGIWFMVRCHTDKDGKSGNHIFVYAGVYRHKYGHSKNKTMHELWNYYQTYFYISFYPCLCSGKRIAANVNFWIYNPWVTLMINVLMTILITYGIDEAKALNFIFISIHFILIEVNSFQNSTIGHVR